MRHDLNYFRFKVIEGIVKRSNVRAIKGDTRKV